MIDFFFFNRGELQLLSSDWVGGLQAYLCKCEKWSVPLWLRVVSLGFGRGWTIFSFVSDSLVSLTYTYIVSFSPENGVELNLAANPGGMTYLMNLINNP